MRTHRFVRARSLAAVLRRGAVPIAAAIAASPAAAQSVSYIGSVQAASGTYIFTNRSSSAAVWNGVAVDAGRLRLSVSLPLVYASRPWVTYGGSGPIPTGGPQHGTVADSTTSPAWRQRHGAVALETPSGLAEVGVGDPVAFVEFELGTERGGRRSVRLTGAVKAPVADVDEGFGTGEWDAAGGIALSQSAGRLTVFADASYWVLGDMADLELRDVVAYGAAIGAPIDAGPLAALIGVSGSTAAIVGTAAPVQAGVALTYAWLGGGTFTGGFTIGLTETAPDIGATIAWKVPLTRVPTVIANRSVERAPAR